MRVVTVVPAALPLAAWYIDLHIHTHTNTNSHDLLVQGEDTIEQKQNPFGTK